MSPFPLDGGVNILHLLRQNLQPDSCIGEDVARPFLADVLFEEDLVDFIFHQPLGDLDPFPPRRYGFSKTRRSITWLLWR